MEISSVSQSAYSYWKQYQQASSVTDSEEQKASSFDASQLLQDAISAMDSDGDGQLTAEELGISDETMSALDTDGDGALSESELQEGMEAQNQELASAIFTSLQTVNGQSGMPDTPPPPPPAEGEGENGEEQLSADAMTTMDSDGDGQLSSEELSVSDETFDELDTNQDGYVSQEELMAGLKARNQDLGSAVFGALGDTGDTGASSASAGDTEEGTSSALAARGQAAYEYQMNLGLFDQGTSAMGMMELDAYSVFA